MRRALSVALGAALALGAPAAAARAQRVATPVVVAARAQTVLDPATRDSVNAIVAEAEARGLPTEPLYTKALEGVEKGADGARIRARVRALFDRLEDASAALRPAVNAAELMAGADALAAEVPRGALRELRRLSPGRSTAVPLGVLTQLVSRGVPKDQATATVLRLLRRGGGEQQLLALERSVTQDIELGLTPDAALELHSKALVVALPAAAPPSVGTTNAGTTTLSGPSAGGTGRKP